MKEKEFFICRHCGNVAVKVVDKGPKLVCCGDEMQALKANTQDASQEKHVPAVKVDGNRLEVNIGSVDHPMTEEHHIAFIFVQTDKGGMKKDLPIDGKPFASFCLDDEKAVAVYEYCNLHGLWKLEL
ncbi:MAG: desulfoferrodoxin family protein [Sphaerochaeta sp.]|jgi:superoxide reductase|nr:desulfoferrodoxin [Spirochaetales bacterium]